VPVRAVVTDLGHANRAFMMNSPLDIFDDLTDHPDYIEHLKRLHRLKVLTSRYFHDGEFSDAEGFSLAGTASAALMVKSYREAAGEFLALVAVNTSANPQQANLRPDPIFATQEVHRFGLDSKADTLNPASEIRLDLPAFDVQVLVFGTL